MTDWIKLNSCKVTLHQIMMMQQAIGFKAERIKGTKFRRYVMYRNGCRTAPGGTSELNELTEMGLMAKADGRNDFYYVTKLGIEFLERITAVQIFEED